MIQLKENSDVMKEALNQSNQKIDSLTKDVSELCLFLDYRLTVTKERC
jgi:cell fate (sporulation/competence/biofilm development) regulator YmcA (YheA/YmcA/DUF963 family)